MPKYDVVIAGAGFTGLAAAMRLARAGKSVAVIDPASSLGGLASTFTFSDGIEVERFYHHWFNHDHYIPQIAEALGVSGDIKTMPSRTGMYFNGRIWSLSSPMDLLKFNALPLKDRVRLGLATLRVRRVKDWKDIEGKNIREWLEPLTGTNAYEVVWEPLVTSKFGKFADEVTAVWMWKKLVLRGSTRSSDGGEQLAYFKGGFGKLAEAIGRDIEKHGGVIRLNEPVESVVTEGKRVTAVKTRDETIEGDQFLFTPAFPIVADIFENAGPADWLQSLRRVDYLGNICLVLRLKRSLSETYWLNVNDPGFPFVGVIEHTNFDDPSNYGGDRIAYLSRYAAPDDKAWQMNDEEYLEWALEHLGRMFPAFDREWIRDHRTWRADFAQPIAGRNYSEYMPKPTTPYENAYLQGMAHIYPEDRGTNYAVRDGFAAADRILGKR